MICPHLSIDENVFLLVQKSSFKQNKRQTAETACRRSILGNHIK